QPRERVEARDAEVKDRLDTFLLESVDDVGGDASIDRGLDRGGVGLIDEHRDRAFHRPADLEHLLEHVAARVFQVDQDDVGVDGVDAGEQVGGALNPDNVEMAGVVQAVLQNRGAHRAFVDDHNVEGGVHRQDTRFKPRAKYAPMEN